MSDRKKVNDVNKPSATEVDSENVKTSKEKIRDGITKDDVRQS